MIQSHLFIKIDNKLFDKLSTQEMYVYCYIKYRHIMPVGYTETSIDLLSDNIHFVKNVSINKQRIKDILLKLEQQEIIQLEYEGEIKNNSTLRIRCTETNSLFTKLPYKYIDVKDHQELYVIAILCKWQNANNKTFSQTEWANMLGVARSTMQRIFDRMEEKNLLYIESGKQYQTSNGDIRQENNKYYLVGDNIGQATTDESVITEVVSTGTVASSSTVEDNQIDPLDHAEDMPDISPVLVAQAGQASDQPDKQSFFVFNGQTHSVQEILQRLRHTDRNVKVYMTEVDYVWYQLNKQFQDKKTVNLVEAKIRGMKNSKSDYPRQQLAEWQEAYKKYQGQTTASKIRELARTQPVVVMKDGSFTTDLDNLALDYDDMVQIYYIYNGEIQSSQFINGREDEMGNMCEVPMTTVEKQDYIGRVLESYKQKAV